MTKIIKFDEYGSVANQFDISINDLIIMFLYYKNKEGTLTSFDYNAFLTSLYNNSQNKQFSTFFNSTEFRKENIEKIAEIAESLIVNLISEKVIARDPSNPKMIYIIDSNEYLSNAVKKYDENILISFSRIMCYINNDLEFGIGNWENISEDEVVEVPGYPSFVTDEFIDKDKNNNVVKKQLKKRAIDNLKNIYN